MPSKVRLSQAILKNFFAKAALLLVFFIFSSCADQGCIDADDFGEYESQTVEVKANSLQESCTFDPTKELTDSEQGSGIKLCLISGAVSITDENGITKDSTNNKGCNGFDDMKFRNICTSNCVQSCLSNSSSSSLSAEPNWNSTDKKVVGKNIGVTIRPGSQIIIRAIGNVVLGNTVEYPNVYVKSNDSLPGSYNINWQDTFFDVRANQSLSAKFSGRWNDGTNWIGGGTSALSGSNSDAPIYNGAKRLAIYMIPHPTGYDIDISQTTEKLATKVVPLLPDAAAWQCTYTGADKKQSTCLSGSYVSNGYTNADDALTGATFTISSAYKSEGLSQYGGMVRWLGDGLESEKLFDPFSSSVCNLSSSSGSCTVSGLVATKGAIIGDLSAGDLTIPNPSSTDAYKVSFKSLSGDSGCNTSLNVTVVNLASTPLYEFSNVAVVGNVAGSAGWSSEHISLEPNQKLIISQNTTRYNGSGTTANCGKAIAVRFNKYHDLKITRSGFVKFTSLRGSSLNNNCVIKGRIINPDGVHAGFSATVNGSSVNYTSDFYEYDGFNAVSSNDPLSNLPVLVSPVFGAVSWSNKVYVRKGQIIRFSPESWNDEWTTSAGLTRQCGIGMAMMIEPRPALLCRGKANALIDNPECVLDYSSSGALLGCQTAANECNVTDCTQQTIDDHTVCVANASSAFCPTNCRKTVNCTAGDATNNYTKTCTATAGTADSDYGNGIGSSSDANKCHISSQSTETKATCNRCASKMAENGNKSAKLPIASIDQCYDLENYKGKVANISSSNAQTKEYVESFLGNSAASKGATKLTIFNGSYGNMEMFGDSGTTDATTSNKIYQTRLPMTFTKAGRLRFFVIDGTDFNNNPVGTGNGAESAYSNNSASDAAYNGSNGFKVSLAGNLEFSNGEWLQARLCKESGDATLDCKTSDPASLSNTAASSFVSNQPRIIDITPPSSTSPVGSPPVMSGNYKFDSYGNITRITGAVTGDCTTANQAIEARVGSLFYCHTYRYYNATDFAEETAESQTNINTDIQRLRITFKILDPEIGNCNLSGVNDGIKIKNPFYDSSVSGNQNAMCTGSGATEIPGSGTSGSENRCKKEFFCANKYYNNSGKYYVNVKVKNIAGNTVSSIIGTVIKPVIEVMDGKLDDPKTAEDETTVGQAERVYKLLISDPRYKAILSMSIIVMFTFYGFGFLMGVSELNHSELINRIIKIGLIYLFVGETGWDWFNNIAVKFFKNGTDYLAFMMASSFDNSPELNNALATSNFYDKSILFSGVDKVFSMFFSGAVQKKVSALLFASIFGWAYLILVYYGFLLYVYAVANAVLLYLTAQVFISILFTLGPLFFVFTLFAQTKEMFDNWLKQLIGFSLQQIFLLTTLAFFNMLMYEVIKLSLGYKICWDEVWTINIITRITLLSFWSIASLPPRTNAQSEVGNIGNPEGIPSLFSILFIWVIASLMEKFIAFMTDLAASMSGGLKASAMGGGVASAVAAIKEAGLKKAEDLWNKTGGHAIKRLDQKLFDSGDIAKKEREARKKQNAADHKNKAAMAKAGDAAVDKFKKEKAGELVGKTQQQQREILTAERNKAMSAEGKRLGLDDGQISRLQKDKGFKFEGTNVFAGALQAAKQAATKGGTIRNSLDERDVSTKFSSSQTQDAMKKMNAEQRKAFVSAVGAGKIRVGKNSVATKAVSLSSKDYDEATEQLEKEGIISKMAPGTGWSRKDSEKRQIRDRARNIRAARKDNKVTVGNAEMASTLAREAEYLDKIDKIDESSDNIFSKITRKIDALGERYTPISLRGSELKEKDTKVRRYAQESFASKVRADLENAQKSHKDLKRDRNAAKEELNKIEEIKDEITSLQQTAAKRHAIPLTAAQRSDNKAANAALRRIKELQSDPEMLQLDEHKKKAQMEVIKYDEQIEEVSGREKNLEEMSMQIESAEKIKNRALRAAGQDGIPLAPAPLSPAHQAIIGGAMTPQQKQTMDSAASLMSKTQRTLQYGAAGTEEYRAAEAAKSAYEKASNVDEFEKFVSEHGRDAITIFGGRTAASYDSSTTQEAASTAINQEYESLSNIDDYRAFNNKHKRYDD